MEKICQMNEVCFCKDGYCETLDVPLCEACHKPHDNIHKDAFTPFGMASEHCKKCERSL